MRHFVLFLFSLALAAPLSPQSDALELAPCHLPGIDEELRCGTFSVLENRAEPEGRRIDLNVVVVPALESTALQTPLFYLEGGPGLPASAMAYAFTGNLPFPFARYFPVLRRNRDVILVDHRGTGASNAMHCEGLEPLQRLERMFPPDLLAQCREYLQRTADLTQYTIAAAVQDLEEVRRALGYGKVSLLGGSYGTSLALAYIRSFGVHTERAVLIGTLPLDNRVPLEHARNGQRILDLVFEQCAADPDCRSTFPHLQDEWQTLLHELDTSPYETTFHTEDGKEKIIIIERGPFTEGIRSLMAFSFSQREIPFVISQAAHGDFQPLLRRVLAPSPFEFATGLYLSVQCATTLRASKEDIERETGDTDFGPYRMREQWQACASWPVGHLPEAWFSPVVSDVPVLFISGEMDHETPAAWAEETAAHFSNAHHIIVPFMGHAPYDVSDQACLWETIDAFLKQPDVAQFAAPCIGAMTPFPFLLSEEEE